jgi:hypothetical protein
MDCLDQSRLIDPVLAGNVGEGVEWRDRAAHAEQSPIDEKSHGRGPALHDLADGHGLELCIGKHGLALRLCP